MDDFAGVVGAALAAGCCAAGFFAIARDCGDGRLSGEWRDKETRCCRVVLTNSCRWHQATVFAKTGVRSGPLRRSACGRDATERNAKVWYCELPSDTPLLFSAVSTTTTVLPPFPQDGARPPTQRSLVADRHAGSPPRYRVAHPRLHPRRSDEHRRLHWLHPHRIRPQHRRWPHRRSSGQWISPSSIAQEGPN